MIIKSDIPQDELKKLKFIITHNKGFHIKFKNGWKVSVQFGWGNYCDDYNAPINEIKLMNKFSYGGTTAEVWSWNEDSDKCYPKNPLGYQTPEQVLEFMNKVRRKSVLKIKEKKIK